MMKPFIQKMLFYSLFILCSLRLFAQAPTTESPKNHIVNIKQDASYKISAAMYTSSHDTVNLLREFNQDIFRLLFLNKNESTVISLGEVDGKIFLVGYIKYKQTFKTNEAHFDLFDGQITSGVHKENEQADILITKHHPGFEDENNYYLLAISYADKSVIQLIFYTEKLLSNYSF